MNTHDTAARGAVVPYVRREGARSYVYVLSMVPVYSRDETSHSQLRRVFFLDSAYGTAWIVVYAQLYAYIFRGDVHVAQR